VDFEAVAFRNESEFGIQLQQDPANPLLTIATQEAEEIDGYELTFGFAPSQSWRISLSAVKQDGERDANRDGTVDTNLDNVRIAPLKITAGVDFVPSDRWNLRVQAVHSGSRDPFPGQTGNNVLNLGRNESFTVIDVLGSLQLGPGRLSLAVNNLTNEEYWPRWAQSQNRNDRYSAAPGANAKVMYAVSF
jgi:iron complex outermembrane receptor protein